MQCSDCCGTHLPFFRSGCGRSASMPSWIGIIIAVPAVTRFTILPFVTALAERRQALRGALDAHVLCDRARLCVGRRSARAVAGLSCLCRDLRVLDADAAAHGCLCAARRAALWPRLRTAAAVGIGGVRGRRAGLRAAGRTSSRRAADLGHRRARGTFGAAASLALQIWTGPRPARPRSLAIARCCATAAFSPSSWRPR